jgi:hypothetical protein
MALLQTVTKKKDVLTFGKHKGQEIGNVILLWPSYILWLCKNGIVKMPKRFMQEAVNNDAKETNNRIRHALRRDMNGWDGWLDD